MKKSILLVCFWQLVAAVSAQPHDIKFTSLTSRDGLISNSVNAILKDRYGFMWFATDDGLNKFDGTNFTVYRQKPGDSTSLRANEILALHEDKSGNLWVATSGGAISLYDREKDRFIHYPARINAEGLTPNGVVRSICSDYLGMIWMAQFESPYVLDPATGRLSRVDITRGVAGSLSGIALFCVFEDSRRRMWIGTDKGLFLYLRETHAFRRFRHNSTVTSSLANDTVRALAEDKSGNLWIGTSGGLCMMRPDADGFVSYRQMNGGDSILAGRDINAVAVDKDGILWVGAGRGLHVMDPRTGRSVSYMPEYGNTQSLTGRWIKCVYIDKEGIYWFGTFRGGINKYDKNLNLFGVKLSDAFHEIGSSSSIVTSFAERRDGNVYVGTDGGGLYTFNRATEQLQRTTIQPKAGRTAPLSILALKMTNKGKLYIGTYADGLLILDPATGKTQQLTRGPGLADLNANDIYCLMEDSKGAIWAGTNGAGINVLKDNKVVARFSPNPGASNEIKLPVNGYIRAIAEDAEGNIWIGTHGGGVAVYDPRIGRFRVFNKDNSTLPSDKIQTLMRGSKGQMWIGTFDGLSLFDSETGRFTSFSEKDGLQNTTIYKLIEDMQGRIWMSTNTGISSLDVHARVFRNYNHSNGIQNSNMVHASGLRLSDGEMFFGGLQGFNYFNPATLTTNKNVPVVVMADLKVSNKSVSPGDDSPIKEQISVTREIRLAYKQNFALSFVALNYTIAKQNQYAYKLEGFDKDWIYNGSANTAYYTNLDPGTYTFRVKASNNDGVWSSKDTSLKIYVKPPFWRTTYAYIFYVLAAGCLLWYSRHRGMARLKKKFDLERGQQEARRVQELDRLKLKFLTNLSHEFRTPISLIMGPVDQLLSEQRQEKTVSKLHMIKRNGRRLLNLVNQLLDFRKMEEQELKLQLSEDELVAFVKDVSHSFIDLAERKHIQFTVHSEIDAMHVFFDHDKMERILFNLLSNAFKFTLEGGAVAVILQEPEENAGEGRKWVSIKVKDTGIGMPVDTKEKIFERFFQNDSIAAVLNQGSGIGLSITKEFVHMHGGTIAVESEPGKGSIFTIKLPLLMAEPSLADSHTAISTVETDVESTETTTGAGRDISPGPAKNSGELPIILLVEDSDDFRFYLKDNLRNFYKVIEAADGKEGWQKALSGHPQLIVSDISMPVMDGIALTRKLKADKRTSHIPVILLTALTGEGERLEGLATGANDYITKPFSFEVLVAKIKNLLELRNTLKTTYSRQINVLTPEVAFESEDEKLLRRIVGHLEEHISNPNLSVEFLSRKAGMSRSTLYNKLLELTGQTPVEYIRSFKLDKAAALLEKRDLAIAEVAYMVGFSTPNYFAKAFKIKFGILPSEFAARVRNTGTGND